MQSNESEHEARIATIYGPVGSILKRPGKPPQVLLHGQWRDLGIQMNRGIISGNAFIGSDGVACVISDEATSEEIEALDTALSDASHGELYLVPCQAPTVE